MPAATPAALPVEQVPWMKAVRWGLVAGATAVFLSAIGLVETFDARKVADPFLSLGYVFLISVAALAGYLISKRQVLEGMAPPQPGRHNVMAGAFLGMVGGVVLAVFLLAVGSFDVREILINVSPNLIDLLSLGMGTGGGAAALVVLGAAVGALGGALHLIGPRTRSGIVTGIVWVVVVGLIELVIGSILREVGLGAVDSFFFTDLRGLAWPAALLVFLGAFALDRAFNGRLKGAAGRFQAMSEPRRRQAGFIFATALLAAGMGLPAVFGPFINEVLASVGLFMLMGLGLNVVVGFAGLLDLGYVAFFAVGAYTTAVLTSPQSPGLSPEMAFFEAIPFVLLMAAIAGLIVGTPVIRMRGDYLAIVTLAFGEIARLIFQADWLKGAFGGAQGILQIGQGQIRTLFGYVLVGVGCVTALVGVLRWRDSIRMDRGEMRSLPGSSSKGVGISLVAMGAAAITAGMFFPDFASWTVTGIDSQAVFRMVLVFVGLASFVSWRLQESRVGRAWMAMREDEQVASSMGINVVTAKLLAFVIGAMLASVGGALFAVKLGTIFPSSFKIVQSIIILVIVIVGGMGSVRGVAIGALVLVGILGGPTQPGLLREFQEFKLLLYGVILIFMMLQRPEGLLPSARRSRELHQEEFLQDAWIKTQEGVAAEADARSEDEEDD